jgi:hypothetical protein
MSAALIQPAEVKRDEDGNWFHPELPTFAGTDESTQDSPIWSMWLEEQGLDCRIFELEDEPSDPAFKRWFEDGDPDFSDWQPPRPAGAGWFLLSIVGTEDGPAAFWVRRLIATPSTDASAGEGVSL